MRLPDFEGWAVFAAVADNGSFTAAADRLGLAKATVSKAVTRLEEQLGTVLFHRTSRRISLAAAGESLLPHARRIVSEGEAAMEAARGEKEVLAGRVRVAAPMSFGLRHLGPLFADFMGRYPDIEVDLHLSDARTDLVEGGFDIALRIAALEDSSLRAIRLCPVSRHIVAAPSYLERYGTPQHPRDLAEDASAPPDGHRCFLYSNLPTPDLWHFSDGSGAEFSVRPRCAIRSNNSEVFMAALLAGQGIAHLPDFLCVEELATGRLVSLLPQWCDSEIAMHIVMPPSPIRPARVEALIAFLRKRLSPDAAE